MKKGAIDGVKVVDLSRVLGGPYCTQILADHGAEIIKVEPPGGDETRTWGPPFVDGVAAYFAGVNRNKQGIVLDLSEQKGRDILFNLLSEADVLVENFKPSTLARWGLDYDEVLSRQFPELIHCAITGFGPDGPLGGLPGYDAIIQAMAGLMSVNGSADSGPSRVGVPVVDMVTGMNAALAVMLALYERQFSGKGQSLDIALYDSGISFMHPHLPNYFADGRLPQLTGNDHPNISPYSTFRTSDGPIFLAVGNNRQFAKLCELLGAPELPDDPRFADNADRCENRETLRERLEDLMRESSSADLARQLIHAGIPAGPVQDIAAMSDHPHTHHREMIVDIGEYRGTGSPIKMSRTPPTYRTPPPEHGADSRAVLDRLGIDRQTQERLFAEGIIKEPAD